MDNDGNAVTYDGTSWSSPVSIDPGNPLSSVSCPSTSFCAATDYDGNALTYDGTSWSLPLSIDPGNSLSSVSCPSTSFCVTTDNDGNAVTYSDASWSAPLEVDPSKGNLISVSCATSSFCAAVDQDGNGNAITYNGTSWTAPVRVDRGNGLAAVSCPTASFCMAVDEANSSNAFTYDGAAWSSPVLIDGDGVISLSCPTTRFCVAVNTSAAFTYPTQEGSTPTQAVSTTTITSVSSAQLGEPTSIGVTVTGPTTTSGSLTPSGLVIVTDGTRTCEATLSGSNGVATGTCPVSEQSAGNYLLSATYPGDEYFASSATLAPTSLRVSRATTRTVLQLSASKVTYGSEQLEHFSVTVSPSYSGLVPNGTVVVMKSTTTLCTITLSSAKGSCSLKSNELPSRTFSVYANYAPSPNFAGSTSFKTRATLTVAKKSTRTAHVLTVTEATFGNKGVGTTFG